MKNNIVAEKSVKFAIRLTKLYKYLSENKREYIISKQLLRSGTAIGAMIREAVHAESKADFLHKINIALKEANETDYWLLILKEGGYLNEKEYQNIWNECNELISILVSIVRTTKVSLGKLIK
jgi:four helix bundle protein